MKPPGDTCPPGPERTFDSRRTPGAPARGGKGERDPNTIHTAVVAARVAARGRCRRRRHGVG